ncbi:MAG TPA: SPFH domain-containing protein [Gammaproteobacteria bacterium]
MSTKKSAFSTHENTVHVPNGWVMLIFNIGLLIAGVVLFVLTARAGAANAIGAGEGALRVIASFLLEGFGVLFLIGHFTLQPNEGRVLILFGSYKGTVRESGFHWANPFYSRSRGKASGATAEAQPRSAVSMKLGRSSLNVATTPTLSTKISLRAHNFNSDTLKVNDKRGNPVEIAAVVVWRVADTAQAVFDVDDYESYVQVQSESAIRSIASLYAYDHGEGNEVTLRGGGDEIAHELKRELEVRLTKAGVEVDEARLTHLAYAPEIASAMLRRQQAEAVIAAREKIVLGAVSMVESALNLLESKAVVKLDEERKAAMVSNLLVVLCGTAEASPVINTGTLYT